MFFQFSVDKGQSVTEKLEQLNQNEVTSNEVTPIIAKSLPLTDKTFGSLISEDALITTAPSTTTAASSWFFSNPFASDSQTNSSERSPSFARCKKVTII